MPTWSLDYFRAFLIPFGAVLRVVSGALGPLSICNTFSSRNEAPSVVCVCVRGGSKRTFFFGGAKKYPELPFLTTINLFSSGSKRSLDPLFFCKTDRPGRFSGDPKLVRNVTPPSYLRGAASEKGPVASPPQPRRR